MKASLTRRAFLALLGSAALAGCSAQTDTTGAATDEASTSATSAQTAETEDGSSATSNGAANDGAATTLVAYFSATGNTRRVAEFAADELGADLFEIVPAEPYTSSDLDYNSDSSRVSQEHAQGLSEVELASATPEGGLDGYDLVLVGYPIWWGGAAWPVGGFALANDLAGKTVVPFCTSASSGAGTSGEDLVGVAATRFSSSAAEDEVRSWAAGLGV